MLLLASLLALGLAQDCRWKQSDDKLQLNGIDIFDLNHLFLFVGKGKLDITDHRGTFWVDDYTGRRLTFCLIFSKVGNNLYYDCISCGLLWQQM